MGCLGATEAGEVLFPVLESEDFAGAEGKTAGDVEVAGLAGGGAIAGEGSTAGAAAGSTLLSGSVMAAVAGSKVFLDSALLG